MSNGVRLSKLPTSAWEVSANVSLVRDALGGTGYGEVWAQTPPNCLART